MKTPEALTCILFCILLGQMILQYACSFHGCILTSWHTDQQISENSLSSEEKHSNDDSIVNESIFPIYASLKYEYLMMHDFFKEEQQIIKFWHPPNLS